MQQHQLKVSKTARYFTLGDSSSTHVWIVLHGYGMLANKMLSFFENVGFEDCYFIAPEGLSRFYWKGFQGDVVASWMTKEDRMDEINDYINYLNDLVSTLQLTNKKINVLGFSQGVATLSRWLAVANLQLNTVVFWAGEPAYDLDYTFLKEASKSYYVYGNQDLFIQEEQVIKISTLLANSNIEIIQFEGKHELEIETIKKIVHNAND